MGFLLLLARILFSALFISSGFNHLTNTGQMGEYAAAKNVPLPKLSVFVTGIMLVLGGFSILLGIWVSVGAWLLIIFLVPTAFMMHNFWAIDDPQDRQNQQVHFFKNMAMTGGAFFIWYLYMTVDDLPLSLNSIL